MGVALVALFVALTGTSIAAVSAFPANSVGARELKNGSVGTKELKGRSVTFGKIAAGAITSGLVRNGSLTMADFDHRQLPTGVMGPVGPPGPTGAPGLKGEKGAPGALLGTIRVPTENIMSAAGATDVLYTVELRPILDRRGVVIGYQASGANGTGTQRIFTLYVLCYRR